MREQNDISNGCSTGKHHHQSIYAYALAGCWRQSDLQRTHVVMIIVHGFIITGGKVLDLLAEPLGLIFRIV